MILNRRELLFDVLFSPLILAAKKRHDPSADQLKFIKTIVEMLEPLVKAVMKRDYHYPYGTMFKHELTVLVADVAKSWPKPLNLSSVRVVCTDVLYPPSNWPGAVDAKIYLQFSNVELAQVISARIQIHQMSFTNIDGPKTTFLFKMYGVNHETRST